MLAKDTIADVAVGSAGEEGKVVGSPDSIEDGAIVEEDGTSHAVFVRFEVEWPVVCSSRWGSVAGLLPQAGSREFLTKAMSRKTPRSLMKQRIWF